MIEKKLKAEEVRALFSYDGGTGRIRLASGEQRAESRSGLRRQYLKLSFRGQNYYLHHLVWAFHHGVWPTRLDHRNRNTTDNRIENLRECSVAQNQYNSCRKANNRSGHKGVVFQPQHPACPWFAKIGVNGRTVALGNHATKEAAAAAYAAAAKQYAGEFARIA